MTVSGEGRDEPTSADTTISMAGLSGLRPVDVDSFEAGLTREELAAVDALPPGSALLIVQRGPNTGARFLLDAERTTAGRHPSSEIFLDDVTVSRKHAEFISGEGGFRVRDVGSLNGTYVNRDRIDDVLLAPGDEVQIGKFRMVYHPSRRSAASTGSGSGA